uniref:G_PROTEIN_RECEP_F1_2 domain-containing protein n=1 Tax=Strongyloides stercoralis TaxID=6248 RepID=A0A0K0EKH3_STRER
MNDTLEDENGEYNTSQICDEIPKDYMMVFTLITTCISVAGVGSNIFLLYILLRKSNTVSFLYYVILAILDLLLNIFYLISFCIRRASQYFELSYTYQLVTSTDLFLYVIGKMIQMAIPYILIAATAERLEKVTSFRATSKTGSKRMLNVFLILSIVILIKLPQFGGYVLVHNEKCPYFQSIYLGQSDLAFLDFYHYQDLIVNFIHVFVSFVILLILNIVIIKKLRQGQQAARRHSTLLYTTLLVQVKTSQNMVVDDKRERLRLRSAVRTTFAIISSYLACNVLNFFLYNLENFYNDILWNENRSFSDLYTILSELTNVFFVISSSIRLFIYYKYNDDIRSQILGIFNCHKPTALTTN